ncbi:MAG: hypothetical protein ABIF40_05720 [archaeon]
MDQEEKYRLIKREKSLAIIWAFERENYVTGDFYVSALTASTNIDGDNSRVYRRQTTYTDLMTLSEIRQFIFDNRGMCGAQLHDCIGLKFQDEKFVIEFDGPIEIRNYE